VIGERPALSKHKARRMGRAGAISPIEPVAPYAGEGRISFVERVNDLPCSLRPSDKSAEPAPIRRHA
jgi:hypothetical protein